MYDKQGPQAQQRHAGLHRRSVLGRPAEEKQIQDIYETQTVNH